MTEPTTPRPAPDNYGRAYHTRWARTWRRWFIGEVTATIVTGTVAAAMDALVIIMFVTSANEELHAYLPTVIQTCIVAVITSAMPIFFGFGARKSWSKYAEDRDKAREATYE